MILAGYNTYHHPRQRRPTEKVAVLAVEFGHEGLKHPQLNPPLRVPRVSHLSP
jgi:hypothetical protein